MKTITAYAVVDKNGVMYDLFETKKYAMERCANRTDRHLIPLTGEYDDTPKLKPCPFCGEQPKVETYMINHREVDEYGQIIEYKETEVTCCNGIRTTLESWESRV